MKPLAFFFFVLSFCVLSRASSESPPTDIAHPPPVAPAPPVVAPAPDPAPPSPTAATPEVETSPEREVASLLRIGEAKSQQQDWASAQLAYAQVLVAGAGASPVQVRVALLGLARAYRGDLRLTKACAVYERYIKDYAGDEQLPTVYLELGRCLRALGAHRLAIARFYSVINSTLKLPEEGPSGYRQLARTAQFEIAETHFLSGDYDQAFRFYSRLRLLDLAPPDRARAAFKAAYALNLKRDYTQAVTQLRAYLELYPDAEDAPESRYLLAVALYRLGRTQESLAATLELLKIEQARTTVAPQSWAHWQRKTGNHLANEFYEQGDTLTALTIYQCLHDLGGPLEWSLPVQYQIGLCQERLRQAPLARATYQAILDAINAPKTSSGSPPALLQDIGNMVAWRLKHLAWLDDTNRQTQLFSAPEATKVSATKDLPASSIPSTP